MSLTHILILTCALTEDPELEPELELTLELEVWLELTPKTCPTTMPTCRAKQAPTSAGLRANLSLARMSGSNVTGRWGWGAVR